MKPVLWATLLFGLRGGSWGNVAKAETTPVPNPQIVMGGFVQNTGVYRYRPGMTVGDALIAAGGYGHCSACEAYRDKYGSHPTYEYPPRLRRQGNAYALQKHNADWMKFRLEPGDVLEFGHILW